MSKVPSIAFLTVGILLLVYGLDASNSITSSVTQAVNGAPTNPITGTLPANAFTTVWMASAT